MFTRETHETSIYRKWCSTLWGEPSSPPKELRTYICCESMRNGSSEAIERWFFSTARTFPFLLQDRTNAGTNEETTHEIYAHRQAHTTHAISTSTRIRTQSPRVWHRCTQHHRQHARTCTHIRTFKTHTHAHNTKAYVIT